MRDGPRLFVSDATLPTISDGTHDARPLYLGVCRGWGVVDRFSLLAEPPKGL